MSIDCRHPDVVVSRILNRSANELLNGDYSEMTMVDLFEIWTLRSDGETDHVASHVKYDQARDAAYLLVLMMEAGNNPEIVKSIVIWVHRGYEEDSVLEVGIMQRADDGS